jgi:uncharacterized protein YukE
MPTPLELQTTLSDLHRLVEILEQVQHELEMAAEMAEDADTATETIDNVEAVIADAVHKLSPIVNEVAQVPVEPLPDLKPVGTALNTVDHLLQHELNPVIGAIRRITQKLKNLLRPFRRRMRGGLRAQPDLAASLLDAVSVTRQIAAKQTVPFVGDMARLAQPLVAADAAVHKASKSLLDDLQALLNMLNKLGSLETLVKDLQPITDLMQPIGRAMSAVWGSVRSPLNKVWSAYQKYFQKYERQARKAIDDALKKVKIDLGFVKKFEAQVQSAANSLADQALKPLKRLQAQIENKVGRLLDELGSAVARYSALQQELNAALAPLQAGLDAYIAEAGKHGIHPRRA